MGRTYRVSRALLTTVVGSALMATALGTTVSAQDPVTFRVGITESPSPTAMNPYLAVIAEDYLLFADQYDLLVGFGENVEAVPGLAESWDVSDDGLTWTYKMRPGVTWSDGTPFTAEDVRFQFQYIRDSHDPAYVGPQAPNGNDTVDGDGAPNPDGSADYPLSLFDSYLDLDGGLENSRITSIEAPDDLTLVITTSAPIATLAQIFIPILPKHIWQDITFEDASVSPLSVEQSVGTGPFKMVQFDPEQAVVLEARDDYWGGAPYIDELVYQFFDNDEAQVNALISGDVDYLEPVPADPRADAAGGSRRHRQHRPQLRFRRARLQQLGAHAGALRRRRLRRLPQGPHDGLDGRPVADPSGRPGGPRGPARQAGAHRVRAVGVCGARRIRGVAPQPEVQLRAAGG